jgi:hypothetical protein
MSTINSSYNLPVPTNNPGRTQTTRETWREDMLNQLLNNMRKHPKNPPETETQASNNQSLLTKGLYINVYV